MKSDTKSKVKSFFGKHADAYISSDIHAKGEDLEVMIKLAGNVNDKAVLDIATGAGHAALAFAQAGAKVVATDLTPNMLSTAEKFCLSKDVVNIRFEIADAEDLHFKAALFDIVTCRIAAHHFSDPKAFVREVARVLKPGGLFLLIDNIVPNESELADAMNYIEKTRDSSHVAAYSVSTWIEWFGYAGLELFSFKRIHRQKKFSSWVEQSATPDTAVKEITRYVLGLPEHYKQYFGVQYENGKLQTLCHEAGLFAVRSIV